MSYGPLFRHQWRLGTDASSRKTLVRLIGVGTATLGAFCFGLVAEDVIRAVRPARDPLRWMNGMLLTLGALYVVGRGYQGGPSLQPYLSLPISRKQLVRFGLGSALLHPVNLAIIAFGLGLWGRTVVPVHSWAASVIYGLGLLLGLGAATHLSRLFAQSLARRPLRVVLLAAGGGLVAFIGFKTRLLPVFTASEALFGSLLGLRALPLLLLAGGYVGSAALHRRQLRRRLYLDEGHDVRRDNGERDRERPSERRAENATTTPRARPSKSESATDGAPRAGVLSRGIDRLLPLGSRGRIGALVAMEWRLVSRNRQPRRLGLGLLLPVITALFVGVVAATGTPMTHEWAPLLIWGIGVGGWVLDYGTKVLSWEGWRLDGILSRAVQPRDLLAAKGLSLGGGTLVLWALPLPVIVFAGGTATGLHAAFLLYVLGWGLPVALAGAPFNTTPIDLNDRSLFNATETGWGRIGASALILGPAVGLFAWTEAVGVFAGGLAVFGGLSALGAPLWERLLRRLWAHRLPALLEAFRETKG
jgi:hypothetical protein